VKDQTRIGTINFLAEQMKGWPDARAAGPRWVELEYKATEHYDCTMPIPKQYQCKLEALLS
jgi:hypothetical protein